VGFFISPSLTRGFVLGRAMAASQPANFNLQEFTDVGQLLVGGRLYTYAYGTTAQKTAFTDPDGTVPHTYTPDGAGGQYIALNARGELPAPLYLGDGSYDLSLKRADGSTVWTRKADGVDNSATLEITKLLTSLATSVGSALIGFIQTGFGAVARTLQDKNSDIVSVFDFMTDAQKADVRARTFAADVTASLQACLNHCHTKGRTMFVPGGGYRITAQLNKPSSFKFPNIEGEGPGSTEIRSYGLAADTSILLGSGGSGGLTGGVISGILFSSDDGLANGIEFDGQCGVTIRDCKFGKLAIGLLAHNKSSGSFTEFVVAENCDFGPDCAEMIVYRRTGGNDSFHGTGVRNITCADNESSTVTVVPKIRIGGAGSTSNDIIVYNAPLSGQFWKHATVPVIQNNSTRFATNFHGNITLELFSPAQSSSWDICVGTNRTYLLGSISSLQPYTRRGQIVLCDTFETRADGSVSALRKPYQLAPLAMVSGANNIATLSVVTNETYLVRVEFADSASAAKKTYLLCVNFAQNAPASVSTLATLLDYFGGSMPYPAFSITGTTLVATAAFAATVSCSVTVTKIGISSAFGL
jgi:hypothetical protein